MHERGAEPAATRALLAALRLSPAEAAMRTGLSQVQVAGLMAGTLRVAREPGEKVDDAWVRLARLIHPEEPAAVVRSPAEALAATGVTPAA